MIVLLNLKYCNIIYLPTPSIHTEWTVLVPVSSHITCMNVFGKVVDGLDVLKAIEKVETGRRGYHDDVPVENVEFSEVSY